MILHLYFKKYIVTPHKKAKTATEEEGEDLWGKVVELTQTEFRDGNLTEEAIWQTVVLIPKGKGEFYRREPAVKD